MPAAVYVDTHGGTGIGGSDDHAGVDIGRTYTEVPDAQTPEEFLRHLRRGDAEARGEQGSAAKWTHAAMALATRALVLADPAGEDTPIPGMREGVRPERSDPAAVLKMAERVIGEGAAREGKVATDIGPDDARCLLEAWLAAMDLDLRGRELIAYCSPTASLTPTSTGGPAASMTGACVPRSPWARRRSRAAICPLRSTASSRRSSPPCPTRPRLSSSAPRRRSSPLARERGAGWR